MASEIQTYESEAFGNLRTVMDDGGSPLFCAKDVAVALGYKDPTNAIKQHCRGVVIYHPIVDQLGRNQNARFITEGDMYRLIASSKLDSAVQFESWVFDEVLPTIRKHGMYATQQTVEEMLADPDTMIRTLQALKAERQKVQELSDANAKLEHSNDTLKSENHLLAETHVADAPKVAFYEQFMDDDRTFSIQKAARVMAQIDPNMGQKRLLANLRADNVVCKQVVEPTRYGLDRGYVSYRAANLPNGKTKMYAHVTMKGLDWAIRRYLHVSPELVGLSLGEVR